MNNISILVGLKNNLEYTQYFYSTTRELYPEVEICFVSFGSTDGTHEWLDSLKDPFLKYYYSEESKTFSDTFNKATQLATKEYVAYLHNDIVLAPGFLENLQKHIGTNVVVSYTTIEPPIFAGHERPGKIIKGFGDSLETFNREDFIEFVKTAQQEYSNQTEKGITFFMCLHRHTLLNMGGMDNLFSPMFCEDDDLILRLKLKGMKMVTSLDAICYHFVSKTSRFSEEYKRNTNIIEYNSNRNYVRKWNSRTSEIKYDVGFVVKNCTDKILYLLEPWCDTFYLEKDLSPLKESYIQIEQKNTRYNLVEKIKDFSEIKQNDILVEFDTKNFSEYSFNIIQQLTEIIKQSGSVGSFEVDIFNIYIKRMQEVQDRNIICKNSSYLY